MIEDSTLEMIADLSNDEPSTEPAQEPVAEPPAVEPAVEPADPDKEAEAKREQILREIAISPALTNQYAQQHNEPSSQPSVDEAFAQAFPGEEYEPYNLKHNAFLQQHTLAPAFDFIEQQKQEAQQLAQMQQQQEMSQVAEQVNMKAVSILDTYVAGFTGMVDKITKGETLTPQEEAIVNKAVNDESIHMQNAAAQVAQANGVDYSTAYSYVVHNAQIRAQIAQHVGGSLKETAKALGLSYQPSKLTPQQKKQMAQESYVESSNAVPAGSATSFDKALESGNLVKMLEALNSQ